MKISQAYIMRMGKTGYGSGWQICAKTPDASMQALSKFEAQQSIDIEKFEIKRRASDNDKITSQVSLYSSFGNVFLVKKENIGIDGTGRTNYSTHGYIINEQDADEFFTDVAASVRAMPFRVYSDDIKDNLSQEVSITESGFVVADILKKYGIQTKTFAELMRCVYGCIFAQKRQTLVVGLGSVYSEQAAIDIMTSIYNVLPLQIRKKISFSSYNVPDASYYDIAFTNEELNSVNSFNIENGEHTGEYCEDDIAKFIDGVITQQRYDVIDGITKALYACENYIEDYRNFANILVRWNRRKNIDADVTVICSDVTSLSSINFAEIKKDVIEVVNNIISCTKAHNYTLDDTAFAMLSAFEKRYNSKEISDIYYSYFGYHLAVKQEEGMMLYKQVLLVETSDPDAFKRMIKAMKELPDKNGFRFFIQKYCIELRLLKSGLNDSKNLLSDIKEFTDNDSEFMQQCYSIVERQYIAALERVTESISIAEYKDQEKKIESFGLPYSSTGKIKKVLTDCFWKNFSFENYSEAYDDFYKKIETDDIASVLLNVIISFGNVSINDDSGADKAKVLNSKLNEYFRKFTNVQAKAKETKAIRNQLINSYNKKLFLQSLDVQSYCNLYRDYENGSIDYIAIIEDIIPNFDIKVADDKLYGLFSGIISSNLMSKKDRNEVAKYIADLNNKRGRKDLLNKTYTILTGRSLLDSSDDNIVLNMMRASISLLIAMLTGTLCAGYDDGTMKIVFVVTLLLGSIFVAAFNIVGIKDNKKSFFTSLLYIVVSVSLICALSFMPFLVCLIISGALWVISLALIIVSFVYCAKNN